jgi:uncharacterized membrane protein YczE
MLLAVHHNLHFWKNVLLLVCFFLVTIIIQRWIFILEERVSQQLETVWLFVTVKLLVLGGGTAIPSKTCFSSDFVRWSVWPNFIC